MNETPEHNNTTQKLEQQPVTGEANLPQSLPTEAKACEHSKLMSSDGQANLGADEPAATECPDTSADCDNLVWWLATPEALRRRGLRFS